jgi:hypothetical protein
MPKCVTAVQTACTAGQLSLISRACSSHCLLHWKIRVDARREKIERELCLFCTKDQDPNVTSNLRNHPLRLIVLLVPLIHFIRTSPTPVESPTQMEDNISARFSCCAQVGTTGTCLVRRSHRFCHSVLSKYHHLRIQNRSHDYIRVSKSVSLMIVFRYEAQWFKQVSRREGRRVVPQLKGFDIAGKVTKTHDKVQ